MVRHAPAMEEDMALANMGLDLLGQARELYSYAANVEGKDNDEDKFAYLRDVRQYRNLLRWNSRTAICARTMVRQFFSTPAFADLYWCAMMKSADPTLAAIAAKSEKESCVSSEAFVGMDRPARRRHRGKPRARANRDRRSLGLYRRDVRGRRRRTRLIDAGIAVDPMSLLSHGSRRLRRRQRSNIGAAQERLDAAGGP